MENTAAPSAAELAALHGEAEARVKSIAYERPPAGDGRKDITTPVAGEMLKVYLSVFRQGGENFLHYHLNQETACMVLRGRVRFHGPGETILGEYGPREGIFIPGGARYWFEKIGDEDLEILQMVGTDGPGDQRAYTDDEVRT